MFLLADTAGTSPPTSIAWRVLAVIAALVIPVVWGLVINWVFDVWEGRNDTGEPDDHIFPDYQI